VRPSVQIEMHTPNFLIQSYPRHPFWLVFIFTNRRTCNDQVPQPRKLLALRRHDFELQGDTNHVPLEHPGAVYISLCGQRPQRRRKRVDSPGAGGAHQGDGERRPRDRTADGRAREPPFHHFHSPLLLHCCLDIRDLIVAEEVKLASLLPYPPRTKKTRFLFLGTFESLRY
jgi:hypothetical protein